VDPCVIAWVRVWVFEWLGGWVEGRGWGGEQKHDG
jgi:hypothetical protein